MGGRSRGGPAPHDDVTVNGVEFRLTQFHDHNPSESTINGRRFALEEHFVNMSATGAEAVVAVFLKLGADNDSLDSVLNAASNELTAPDSKTLTTPIGFGGL